MTTDTPSQMDYTNYPKSDKFNVTAYPDDKEESYELKVIEKNEIIETNGVENMVNEYEISEKKNDGCEEVEDVLTDLDIMEIERRQREANEETTRSEDLRQFLREMRQKCQVNETANRNNISHSARNSTILSSPVSISKSIRNGQYPNEFSPYKQMIDFNQEGDIHVWAAETAPTRPPDGGWAWLIVLASFFCMITIDGTCFNYGLLIPEMRSSFGENNIMAYMWPGSLISGFYMSMGPVASALSNRFDFRPVAMAGVIISGLGIVLSSFMNNLYAFIVFFGIFGGIGFSLIYLPAIAIVGHWFHEKRSVAVGLALYGSGCGTLLYGQLIPILIEIVTWKGCIILIAGVCFQSLVFIALYRPLEVHLRMQQLWKIRSTIRRLRREEIELKRVQHEKELEAEKERKKEEKNKIRNQNRMKNKKIVIYRGAIMQKIIEEKRRQRTVSVGSLDGMVITGNNELINVPKSSLDLYEKPILSINTINKIRESVVKRLENKINKHGPNGVVNSIGFVGNINTSSAQLRSSLTQMVQDYINSQMSLQLCNNQQTNNGSINPLPPAAMQLNKLQNSNMKSESSLKGSVNHGMVLDEDAKAVIQSCLRKEMTRPFNQKELFFTGSMRQLSNNSNDTSFVRNSKRRYSLASWSESRKRSQASISAANPCNVSINSYTGCETYDNANTSILDGFYETPLTTGGDINGNICNDYDTNNQNDYFRTFFRDLLNIHLLSSPTFMVMVISSIGSMFGIFVPFYLLPCYMQSLDIELIYAGRLISYSGIANTVGRFLATMYIEKAWSSNYRWADCLWINNICLIVAGISVCSIPFLINNSSPLIFVVCIYGLCVAGFASLKSILVVELLGVQKLTNAFGFLLIFQGLATIIGSPTAGWICDCFGLKYEFGFFFAGIIIILSGIVCFPLRRIAKWELDYLIRKDDGLFNDEENSLGISSFVDIAAENEEIADNSYINTEVLTVLTEDTVEKNLEYKDSKKFEAYELNDDVNNLEPVAEETEEEEEDEEENIHNGKEIKNSDLSELK